MPNHQLGIDIGATGIKGALVDLSTGELLEEKVKFGTPKPATKKDVAKVVKQLIDHFSWKGPVGCGFPSIVQNGYCRSASNIPEEWIGTDLNRFFEKSIGNSFVFANDADLAGLAEMEFGSIENRQDGVVILATLGTGIGSAFFYNSVLIPNTELGSLLYKKSKFEKYASNSARKKNEWNYDEWGEHLNAFVHHVDRLFSPEMIILGGGVSKRYADYAHTLTSEVRIEPASLLNNAGIIGAAVLASQHFSK